MNLIAPLVLLTLPLMVIPRRMRGSGVALLAFNLFFLTLVVEPVAMIYLGLFLAISYMALLVCSKWRTIPFVIPLLALILLFIIFKRYEFLPFQKRLVGIPGILGLSFIIFRIINLLYEVYDRNELPSPTIFLNYTLSMFTLISGPIQRYRPFKNDMAARPSFVITAKLISTSLNRLLNGILKVIFIAPPLRALQFVCWGAAHREALAVRLHLNSMVMAYDHMGMALVYGAACFLYLGFLYFNFSGYTDMVIALGRMAGFRLPENFDHPSKAESFLDFWNRWHISLSLWFRDYCFSPILKRMLRLGSVDAVITTLPGYFVCFGLLGIWHGRTWPFMLCGLMFAVAAVVNQAYRSFFLKSPTWSEHYRRIRAGRLYGAVASSMTFVYIALAIQGFWLPGPEIRAAWSAMTLPGALVAALILVASAACVLYLARLAYALPWIAKAGDKAAGLICDRHSASMIAAKAVLICCCLSLSAPEVTEFAYRGF